MVKMINKLNGATMWVTEQRVDEYLSAGHKLADTPTKAAEDKPTSKKRSTRTKK